MNIHSISPLDNRYWPQISDLSKFFSEFAFIKYKVTVEIDYFVTVLKAADENTKNYLYQLLHQFSDTDIIDIKNIENTTKHDIKAIEYWIRQKLNDNKYKHSELVHFGLTSEDINNVAYRLAIKDYINLSWSNTIKEFLKLLRVFVFITKYSNMIGRTHGQPATPTTLGKEIAVYLNRLLEQIKLIKPFKLKAKMNGAIGNWAAMWLNNNINWYDSIKNFLESYGLDVEYITTQIIPYDNLNLLLAEFINLNNVLIDFSQNMWTYISNDYIKLIPIDGEIGSSTMPQKVNPINFELAEGNLGMSNAIASFMIDTLSKSRLQRHLSDSTIIRNIGVVFAHHHLALKSLITCMGKISPNNTKMKEDLESHPEVHLEMIQIILKISGHADGYEKVKDFSRGKERSAYEIRNFINSLPIPQETRQIILNNIDTNYCGSAEQLTDIVLIEADRVIQVL